MAGEPKVVGMSWAEFKEYFAAHWRPGEHIGLCGGTGSGKSTFAGGILDLRRFALVLDPKGGDETLAALKLRRLPTWPGERKMISMLDKDEREGRPSRYIVGPVVNRGEDLPKLRAAIGGALGGAFDMGGWTVFLDEAQVAADRRMMNLSGPIDRLLVAARSKGVSLVLNFQTPRWVGNASLTQPTWFCVSGTRDTDTVNRLAEIMGRPKAEVRGAFKALSEVKYTWLIVGRDSSAPFIITKPDKIAPKRTS
jgi:hypothetical protein